MKTITTKYLPPTNTLGARIKAYDGDGNTAIVPYDYNKHPEEVHEEAARTLCEKMGRTFARLHTGWLRSGLYAHIPEG